MINERLLELSIIEILEKNGVSEISDLIKSLKNQYQYINEANLNKILMKLEIKGKIKVFDALRGKRRVELIRG